MNLPNKITVARVFLVPIFILAFYFIKPTYISAIIFLVASLTDMLDGYLARKNNMITDFGKFMDPLADKILALSAMIIFVENGILPAFVVIIVLCREFTISGFRLIASNKGITMAAGKSGKIKTALQLVGIILVLFTMNNPDFESYTIIGQYIIFASVIQGVISLYIYMSSNKGVID